MNNRLPLPDLTALFLSWDWHLDNAEGAELLRSKAGQLWSDGSMSIFSSSNPSEILLSFWDALAVSIDTASKSVRYSATARSLTDESVDHLLADQILPRLISHDGALVLHAGAVRLAEAGVICIGESGQGKSTLSAALSGGEHLLLSDDTVVINVTEAGVAARAVYPGLRLLPDTIAALSLDVSDSFLVAEYTEKRRLSLAIVADEVIHPIAMLVFLASPSSDEAVTLRRMTTAEACMGLIANSFTLDPTDVVRAKSKLVKAASVASQIPAYTLTYPRLYERLPDVTNAITQEMVAIMGAGGGERKAQ